MKAVVYHRYGSPDVLRVEEVPTPIPKGDEVLVRVHAASANAGDWHALRGDPFFLRFMGFGLLKPRNAILGSDVSGRVEAVGRKVTEFRAGDEVFGATSIGRKLSQYGGAFAEYACVAAGQLLTKPAGLSFEEAAAVPSAAMAALQGLRDKGQLLPGQRVLVNGASGGVGTFAVQIARSFGAEVTGVCSTRNVELVRSIGAHRVVDYMREDFTRHEGRYDVILDTAAYRSMIDHRRALSSEGTYVLVGGSTGRFLQTAMFGPWISVVGSKRFVVLESRETKDDLALVKGLLESGKLAPVLDREYPLSETAEALRHLEEGHARGKAVINVTRVAR